MAFPRETAILGLRVAQALFSIIVLGTAAYGMSAILLIHPLGV